MKITYEKPVVYNFNMQELNFNGLGDFYFFSHIGKTVNSLKSKLYLNKQDVFNPEDNKLLFDTLNDSIEIALEFNKNSFEKKLGSIYLGKNINNEKIKTLLIEKGVNEKEIIIINSIKDIPFSLNDIHSEKIWNKYKHIEELKGLNNHFDFDKHYIFKIDDSEIINFILDVLTSINYTIMINKKCNIEMYETSIDAYMKRREHKLQVYIEYNGENEIKTDSNYDVNISLFISKEIKSFEVDIEKINEIFKSINIAIFKDKEWLNKIIDINEKEKVLFFSDNLNKRLKYYIEEYKL